MQQYDRPRQALAIAAAALAGWVDATGFLAADRYFVSFMSGNTTRLGVDLVQNPTLARLPLLLIAGFVVGVFTGSILAAKAGALRKPVILGSVALLLSLAALARLTQHDGLMLAMLVLAMGTLNNTFQRGGEVSIGLTYMTGALVRMAQGLAARALGRGGEAWGGWALLWLGLASGAMLGAWAWLNWQAAALWGAAAWAAILSVSARRLT